MWDGLVVGWCGFGIGALAGLVIGLTLFPGDSQAPGAIGSIGMFLGVVPGMILLDLETKRLRRLRLDS